MRVGSETLFTSQFARAVPPATATWAMNLGSYPDVLPPSGPTPTENVVMAKSAG